MADSRCTYRETWPSPNGPLHMRCVLRARHGPGISDPGNATVPGNPSHHLDVEHVGIKCPLCDEPAETLVERDGEKMCAECAEHQSNEAALEESYGDAMFDDGGE